MRNKKYIIAVSGILLILVLIALIYFKNKDSNYTNNEMFDELLLNSEYYKASGDYLKSEEILKESLKYNKSEGYYYLGMLYAGSMNDKKRAKEAYIMAYKYKNVENDIKFSCIWKKIFYVRKWEYILLICYRI